MPRQHVRVPIQVKGLLRAIGQLADSHRFRAYVVGGCVRDWLVGVSRTVDLDITTEGSGVELAHAVAHVLEGTITRHQQFGTATVLSRHLRIDFASCRRETYARPAAYPHVTPGTLRDDLFRRDFTINAMAMVIVHDQFGDLIDPFHGAEDLHRKQLRILHARSFLDDPSRILRGVRFAQRFGLRWERRTHRALQEAIAAGALGWLNRGRLHKELDYMLHEPDPSGCLRSLASLLVPPAH